jgi:hypothetical protein
VTSKNLENCTQIPLLGGEQAHGRTADDLGVRLTMVFSFLADIVHKWILGASEWATVSGRHIT